ncbi:MAG: cell division protein FtsZ [Prevotellaceae bacterium]|jgi:cell division protein FtsZ|nr:cell division protein FtsZ [Prevotellaceae bacterium]
MPENININRNELPEIIPVGWLPKESRIKVIGVGGGGNAVNHMFRTGIKEVEFVICNTDAQALHTSPVPRKVQLGEILTRGLGTGCNPEQGRQAAEESKDRLCELLSDNTEMVFITAGMGGGTGTGAAPVIAKIAKEMDILTVGIVTIPFRHEGIKTLQRAYEGIRELKQHVDSLLIVDNQKLCEMYGDLPMPEAFSKADDVLSTAAKGIAEIITLPGHLNVDLADVKMVMKNSGVAIMGAGRAGGERRVQEAVEQALHSPLLNDNDVSGAKNVLVNITTSRNNCIRISELEQIVQYVYGKAGSIENCKHGIVYDENMGDDVSITVVATGFGMHVIPEPTPPAPQKRIILSPPADGVDNAPVEGLFAALSGDAQPAADDGFKVDKNRRVYTFPEKTFAPKTANPATAQPASRPALIPDNEADIQQLEQTPAYLRRKTPLTPPAGHINKINTEAPAKIVTHNQTHRLSANNAFLYQTQD